MSAARGFNLQPLGRERFPDGRAIDERQVEKPAIPTERTGEVFRPFQMFYENCKRGKNLNDLRRRYLQQRNAGLQSRESTGSANLAQWCLSSTINPFKCRIKLFVD